MICTIEINNCNVCGYPASLLQSRRTLDEPFTFMFHCPICDIEADRCDTIDNAAESWNKAHPVKGVRPLGGGR